MVGNNVNAHHAAHDFPAPTSRTAPRVTPRVTGHALMSPIVIKHDLACSSGCSHIARHTTQTYHALRDSTLCPVLAWTVSTGHQRQQCSRDAAAGRLFTRDASGGRRFRDHVVHDEASVRHEVHDAHRTREHPLVASQEDEDDDEGAELDEDRHGDVAALHTAEHASAWAAACSEAPNSSGQGRRTHGYVCVVQVHVVQWLRTQSRCP